MMFCESQCRSLSDQVVISMRVSALRRLRITLMLSSRSGHAFPSPRLKTSFRRICGLSIFETTASGNAQWLYKAPQVQLISHLASLLLTCHLSVLSSLTNRGAVTHHTMSAAKCLVSLMVVLVATVCVVHAQERIKMCGRELIRLAVSSCGNSRLRRSTLDVEQGQHQYTSHWDQDASTDEHLATETVHTAPESDEENDVFSSAPHWYPLSSRIRRAAGKISDICCEKGCSMKELIQFC
ncbi:insulin-like 3 (Leydig cell) [Siniperca chuatsi]|uniref:insulin-like 3 (Leydig cell) n=1 Tax=Siniperca chuatsi TaxID=119488 RepID=UPI001CE14803|nr:insulin-like 3 (Leydig cell) [Siniperca chuatsi]